MEEDRDWTLKGPRWLLGDIRKVADFFRVEPQTIRGWIKTGQFPVGAGSGSTMVWTGADIAAFIQLRGRFSTTTLTDEDVS